jgi:hypothetical protein
MESVIIALIFVGAMGYLGRMVYQQFWGKSAGQCAKGCGSCGSMTTEK